MIKKEDINIGDKVMFSTIPGFGIVISKNKEDIKRLSYSPEGPNKNIIAAKSKDYNSKNSTNGIYSCNIHYAGFKKTKATVNEILLILATNKNEWARSKLKELLKERL